MENDRNVTDSTDTAMTVLGGMGDRELWYAEGERDESGQPVWRFPLFVDYKVEVETGVEYAAVFTAVCPHYSASLVLKALFEIHDKLNRENRWLVRREVVGALLTKAPGITPSRYYRWAGKEEKPIEYTERTMPGRHEPNHLKSGATDRVLIQQIAEECGLQSSVVKIVIDGLNKVAADFLVSQHRVMDLGFVKLIALPFRANWKEIVTFKLRKLGLLRLLNDKGEDQNGESNNGLPETLCSPHNVAIRREKTKKGFRLLSRVDYSLEVITSPSFEKEVTRMETRQHAAGHTAYVSYYEKTVERLYENILEILRAYRKKIGLPFARVCHSSSTGGLRFMETIGIKARAHGRHLRDIPVHIVPPAHGFSAIAEESQQELVCEAAPQVPKLPAFSSWSNDVWQRQEPRSLEEFLDGEGGASGLPLLDASENPAAGESVLPCIEIGMEPPWVDEKGD
jgi:hypothetical protein